MLHVPGMTLDFLLWDAGGWVTSPATNSSACYYEHTYCEFLLYFKAFGMNGISLKFKPSDRRVIWMWLLVQLALYLQVLQLSQLGRGLYLPVHHASKSLPYSA